MTIEPAPPLSDFANAVLREICVRGGIATEKVQADVARRLLAEQLIERRDMMGKPATPPFSSKDKYHGTSLGFMRAGVEQ